MATMPKPTKEDWIISDIDYVSHRENREIDISWRQEQIIDSDDTFMQAPDHWPDPVEKEEKEL